MDEAKLQRHVGALEAAVAALQAAVLVLQTPKTRAKRVAVVAAKAAPKKRATRY